MDEEGNKCKLIILSQFYLCLETKYVLNSNIIHEGQTISKGHYAAEILIDEDWYYMRDGKSFK